MWGELFGVVWHIQTPGSTLDRHKRPQFQGVRALPEQFLRIGPRGGRCVAEGVGPCPEAGVLSMKRGLHNEKEVQEFLNLLCFLW